MKLVYAGPFDEVDVPDGDVKHTVRRGAATDIPDELAARLLEQDTWGPGDRAAEKVAADIARSREKEAAEQGEPVPAAKAAADLNEGGE